MEHNRTKSSMGGKKKSKSKKRRVHSMDIRRAANGGYVAKHRYESNAKEPEMPMEEEHIIPGEAGSLGQHVEDHFGAPEEQEPSVPSASPSPSMP